jgi:hypothetical protein
MRKRIPRNAICSEAKNNFDGKRPRLTRFDLSIWRQILAKQTTKENTAALPALLACAAMMERAGSTVEVISPQEVRAVEEGRRGVEVRKEKNGGIALVLLAEAGER